MKKLCAILLAAVLCLACAGTAWASEEAEASAEPETAVPAEELTAETWEEPAEPAEPAWEPAWDGVPVLPDDGYIHHTTSGGSPLGAAVNMLRARMYLSGREDWTSVTEDSIKSAAWDSNDGLRYIFTCYVDGGSMDVRHFPTSSGLSFGELQDLLADHPEGIVVFTNTYRGVFITDIEDGTVYCAESGRSNVTRIRLTDSLGSIGSQDKILAAVRHVWYVESWDLGEAPVEYSLDVVHYDNGEEGPGEGTFDVYINGSLDANDASEYHGTWPAGTVYELRDFRPAPGYEFLGVWEGERTGVLEADASVLLWFPTVSTFLDEEPRTAEYNGNTYTYYSVPVTWYAAWQICRDLGGELVTIHSAEENEVVASLTDGFPAWIGATDRDEEGNWTWVTGEAFSYDNWASGQPDNTATDAEGCENYAYIGSGQTWNDADGLLNYGFVVETEPTGLCTVSFDANGGSGAPEPVMKTPGEEMTLPDYKPVRGGHIFLGWARTRDAAEPLWQPGGSYSGSETETLYAVWFTLEDTPSCAAELLKLGYPAEAAAALRGAVGLE